MDLGSRSQSKQQLAHTLLDLGVASLITVGDPPHRVIPAHKFIADRREGGPPSKEDLLAAVDQWLEEHPDHNRTVVEQLMDDAGHSMIFTPPFCPEVQPIELLWAKVKRYVADRSTHNRSVTQARSQTEDGFREITKMFCNSIVKHCHDWIDSFLRTDDAGDLQQCGTLAGVIKHLSLLKLAGDDAIQKENTPPKIPPPMPAAAAASCASPRRPLRARH
jgi:hypothetical protein